MSTNNHHRSTKTRPSTIKLPKLCTTKTTITLPTQYTTDTTILPKSHQPSPCLNYPHPTKTSSTHNYLTKLSSSHQKHIQQHLNHHHPTQTISTNNYPNHHCPTKITSTNNCRARATTVLPKFVHQGYGDDFVSVHDDITKDFTFCIIVTFFCE